MDLQSNCSNESIHDLIKDNLLWSISGMVSFSLTFLILLLILFYKAYSSFLQRLFLYFIFVTLMQLACIAMNIELQFVSGREGRIFCQWLGFIQHWAYMMNWLFSLALTCYLHLLLYHQIRGRVPLSIGFKVRRAAEIGLIAFIVILPLSLLWIPFSSYGINGALCWTMHMNDDCSENTLGSTFEIIYTNCCAFVRLLIIVSFLLLLVVFCRLSCLYRHTRNKYLRTVGRTVALMFLLVISACIELIGLLTYIYTAVISKHSNDVVQILFKVDYVVLPFSLVIIPTGFMIYLYSLKMFSCRSVRKAAQEWKCCCACKHRLNYQILNVRVHEEATAPASTRGATAPSETFFNVPYTDGFTRITQEQESLVRIAPASSGYESIVSTAI